jgi:hypothetical protein
VKYYCPLCLNELKPGGKDQLLRFCRTHPQNTRFIDIDPHGMSEIFCPGDHIETICNRGGADTGPLLLHEKCSQINPFWNGSQVDVPATVKYRIEANSDNTNTATLKHWLLSAMRDVPAGFQKSHGMWFPQALFRAFHEQQASGGMASSVLLLGGQAAGKSVLATMAIKPETWRGDLPDGGHLDTSAYAYVSPLDTPNVDLRPAEFIDSLAALIRGDGDLIEGTKDNERNIRALFLNYESSPQEKVNSAPEPDGGLQIFSGRGLSNGLKAFGKAATILWGGAAGTGAPRATPIDIPPPRSAVVFYDLKGESVEDLTGGLLRLIQNLSRIAVVMDATDISSFACPKKTGRRNSAEVALRMLEHVKKFKKEVSLVVTHIDEVRELADPKEWAEYWKPHNAFPRRYHPATPMAEQAILRQVLESGNDIEKGIASALKREKWPVHFVWTENIRKADRYAVGIHGFVAEWCSPGLKAAGLSNAKSGK